MSTPDVAPAPAPSHDGVVFRWQRGVPVHDVPLLTRTSLALLFFVLVGTGLGVLRLFGGALGPFSAMTDQYAWGVWKTFNTMALTALGSGAMGVGIAAWVFGYKHFHAVMRTALLTSLLFYGTGILGIVTDVGRPWNAWNAVLPWHWNTQSPLWEVLIAMPTYCFVFLLYENGPTVVERLWWKGSPGVRRWIDRWHPRIRRTYPYVVAAAYIVPMMHQSSLGALMLLSGNKVHPLWQSEMLPLLYLVQAWICGFAAVIAILMASCLVWRRPLDMKVLADLARVMSSLTLFWLTARVADLAGRGVLSRGFSGDRYSVMFLVETLAILVPAIVLRTERFRQVPRVVFTMAVLTAIGGLLYRFTPTTLSFMPAEHATYFPAVPEVLVMFGLVALVILLYSVAVKRFAILPAPLETWYRMFGAAPAGSFADGRPADGHARHD